MKKLLLLIIIMFLCFPLVTKAVTMEEYRNAVANVGISTGSNYGDEFIYSYFWGGTVDNPINLKSSTTDVWLKNAKNGIKSSGTAYGFKTNPGIRGYFTNKFAVYCESFVQLMVHHASNGAVSYPADYERINVSEIRKGDLIHFKNHIAVFIDDGNDNSQYTNNVAQASTKIEYVLLNNLPDYGYRLKSSSLSKLDYNYVTSSYDLHDRLDDAMPIINDVSVINGTNKIKIEATDYKNYSLTEKSDVIEPENFGITQYQITEKDITPTTNWINIDKTSNLIKEVELQKNGTYYIWVKDVGGNVAKKQVNLKTLTFDKTPPTLGNLKYNSKETSIEVIIEGASDISSIKEYRYYLDNKLIYTGVENKYLYNNLVNNKIYNIYYEIVDIHNNIAKSEVIPIRVGVSANKITLEKEYVKLNRNTSYTIKPTIDINSNNFIINYQSDDTNVAIVNENGVVYAVNPGLANIKVSVGETEVTLQVRVLKYNIKIMTDILPNASVGKEYKAIISTNINTTLTLSSGMLPPGMRIENSEIVGTPTSEGQYKFTIRATYDDESVEKYFVIDVNEKQEDSNAIIIIAIVLVLCVLIYTLFNLKKKK